MRTEEGWSEENVGVATLQTQVGPGRSDGTVIATAPKTENAWLATFRGVRRSHTAMSGLCVAGLVFLVAGLADVISPYGYADMHPEDMLQHPSWNYFLGTDQMGRDVLSRIIHGSRISIYVGVVSTIFGALMGIPLGILAAYYSGLVDNIIAGGGICGPTSSSSRITPGSPSSPAWRSSSRCSHLTSSGMACPTYSIPQTPDIITGGTSVMVISTGVIRSM